MYSDYKGYFDSWFHGNDAKLEKETRQNARQAEILAGGIDRTQEKVTEAIEPLDVKLDDLGIKIDRAEPNLEGGLNDVYKQIENAELGLKGRFDEVDKQVESTEWDLKERFNDMENQIEDVSTKIDEIETTIDSQLNRTERRLDTRLSKLEFYLDDFRAISRNALCAQGWQRLLFVGRFNWHDTRTFPPVYIQTVEAF